MADDVLASFLVALGFRVDAGSQKAATKSVADYQRAVEQAEKAIEDARWAGAKTEEEVAALARSTNLRLAREALQRAKDEEKLEAEKTQKRKQRFKEFESDLTKLAAVAAAAATALAVTVGRVTGGLNQLYYVSGRTGASAANLKALGYAFEQTGSSAEEAVAAVESFTQAMRSNPGVKGFVENDLHIDAQLDAVHKLQAAVDTLNERYKDNPAVAQAQATGILGLSVAQYNQLTLQGKEIRRLQAERRAFAKSIGLDDNDGANAAQKLSQSLGSVVMMVGALRDKLAIALVPVVETLVRRFGDWIRSNPKQIDDIITSIARGVTEFATALGKVKWEEVFKGISDFATGANNAAQAMGGWKVVAEAFFALWAAGKIAAIFGPIMTAIGGIRLALLRLGPIGWAMLGIGTLGGILASADPNKGIVHGGRSPEGSLNPGDELPGVDSSENRRPGIFARARRAVARRFGKGGGEEGPDGGRLNARQPEGAGRYRPEYKLSDADLDAKVVNTIAGEAIANNPESIDAVINNMLNRVGSKGWGASGNLREVARAPGQYAGYRQAGAKESEFIQSRIRAIASGGVPDNTNGANSYRAAWYKGPWAQKHAADGRVVGGNRYAFEPGFPNGPYAPYAAPKDVPAGAPPAPKPPAASMRGLPNFTPGGFDPNHIDPKDLMRPAPAGASPVTNNTSSTSKAVSQNIVNNVKIEGSREPREHGRIMESSLSRVHGLALANAQTAVV